MVVVVPKQISAAVRELKQEFGMTGAGSAGHAVGQVATGGAHMNQDSSGGGVAGDAPKTAVETGGGAMTQDSGSVTVSQDTGTGSSQTSGGNSMNHEL